MSDNKSRISELKKVIGSVSSSDLCGCSVRVHDNSLLGELFIDGRFRSDLEFALVDKDAQAVNAIAQSERTPRYSDVSFPRHLSPSDYSEVIDASSSAMDDLVKSSQNQPSPVPPAAPAAPAAPVSSN